MVRRTEPLYGREVPLLTGLRTSVDTAGLALAYLSPACDSDRKHGGCQVGNRRDNGCNYGEGVWKVDTEQKAEIGK